MLLQLFSLWHMESTPLKTQASRTCKISRARPLPIQKPGGKDHFGFKQLRVVKARHWTLFKRICLWAELSWKVGI